MTGRVELDRSGRDGLLTLAAVGLGLIAAWAILLRDSGPLPAFVGIVLVMLALGLAVRAYFARIRGESAGFQAFRIMAMAGCRIVLVEQRAKQLGIHAAGDIEPGRDRTASSQ